MRSVIFFTSSSFLNDFCTFNTSLSPIFIILLFLSLSNISMEGSKVYSYLNDRTKKSGNLLITLRKSPQSNLELIRIDLRRLVILFFFGFFITILSFQMHERFYCVKSFLNINSVLNVKTNDVNPRNWNKLIGWHRSSWQYLFFSELSGLECLQLYAPTIQCLKRLDFCVICIESNTHTKEIDLRVLWIFSSSKIPIPLFKKSKW